MSDFKINKNINNYSIQNLFIYNIDVENNYTLNKDNPEFSIFKYNLDNDFKSNSILEVNCKLLYDYTTYNNIGAIMHVFKLHDENNTLLHEYKNLKSNSGDNLKAFLNQIDLLYVKLNDDYSVIKIELVLSILDNINKTVCCKLYNSLSSNFLCIKNYKKISSLSVNNNLADLENDISLNLKKIDTNKNDISNLGKINDNIGNISSNASNVASILYKIDNIKSNLLGKTDANKNDIFKFNKIYLKNFENLILREYNYTILYDQSISFYKKTFNFSFKKNDLIELYIKVLLNYTNINDNIYVNSIYQIENNDTVLYTNIIDHNKYTFFNNHLTINETIFYTFEKDMNSITFLINFETVKNNIGDIKIF